MSRRRSGRHPKVDLLGGIFRGGALARRCHRFGDGRRANEIRVDGEETVISGLLADQPALHGLLAKIRDLGLRLISVRRLDPGETGNEAS
jgi:hypothetical protein